MLCIEPVTSSDLGHEALIVSVVRQALADATGTARKTTLQKPEDRELAAQAIPWLDTYLPRWRRLRLPQ